MNAELPTLEMAREFFRTQTFLAGDFSNWSDADLLAFYRRLCGCADG